MVEVGGLSGPADLGGFRRLLAGSPPPPLLAGGSFFNLVSTALLGCLNCPLGSLLAGFRLEPFGVNCKVLAAETGAGAAGAEGPSLVLVTEGEVAAGLLLFLIIGLAFFTSVAGCLRLSFGLGTMDCLKGSFLTSVWDITLGFRFSLQTFLLGVTFLLFSKRRFSNCSSSWQVLAL